MPKALPMIDISAPVCCAPVAAGPMSDDAALEVALRLKALADPARVKIMSFLFSSPTRQENSGDLATALGLTESTISHHLSQLRKAGLVESDRRGMNVYHRPRRDALGALCTVLDPDCCASAERAAVRSAHVEENAGPEIFHVRPQSARLSSTACSNGSRAKSGRAIPLTAGAASALGITCGSVSSMVFP